MSKTADLRFVADRLGVLLPIPDRLACWIDDMDFLRIVHKTALDPLLAYVTSPQWPDVDWSCVDPEIVFFVSMAFAR